MRHKLERTGGTFTCRNEDFLVSTDRDFHPTDVLQDADGSLLVIDTGGWFRIGCPTSQVSKPDVLGGLSRAKTDAPRVGRGTKSRRIRSQAAAGATTGRWTVRGTRSGGTGCPTGHGRGTWRNCSGNATAETKCAAVWALTSIEGDTAREAVRAALKDSLPGVRQAAARSAGLHREECHNRN
jgi:hypothetical protein